MKRFFCTICQKVKRTQKWPIILQHKDAAYPDARVGECNWHSGMSVRVPVRTRTFVPKAKAVSVPKQTRKRA